KVDDKARPALDMDAAWRVYVQLLRAATSGRASADEFARTIEEGGHLKPEDRSYRAEMLRANTMAHRDWLAFTNRRHQMCRAWAEFFKDWDVLLCPVAASAAFPHDHAGERWERVITVNNGAQPTTTQMFWAGYSGAFYLPSTVAPTGLSPQGLPIGVQIVAP